MLMGVEAAAWLILTPSTDTITHGEPQRVELDLLENTRRGLGMRLSALMSSSCMLFLCSPQGLVRRKAWQAYIV